MEPGNNQTNINSNSNIDNKPVLNNVNNITNSTNITQQQQPPQLQLQQQLVPVSSAVTSSLQTRFPEPNHTESNTANNNNNNISTLPIKTINPVIQAQFSSSKTNSSFQQQTQQRASLPPPPSLTPKSSSTQLQKTNIQRNNQNLFQSLYNQNVTGITHHSITNINTTPITRNTPNNNNNNNNNSLNSGNTNGNHHNKTYSHRTPDSKLNLRRGRPKKSSHSHRKAFEAGHPRFERALQQLIEMRQKHPQGLLPSIRGFMQTIHMGFANTNAVVKYYSNNYLNMTLDDFKRDYMVIRRVRAKTRQNSGGRPKKSAQTPVKIKYDDKSDSSASDSDGYSSMSKHRSARMARSAPGTHTHTHRRNNHNHNHNYRTRTKAPLQPLKMQTSNNNNNHQAYMQQFQQQLLNQFAANNNTNGDGIDFNFPLFFEGIAHGNNNFNDNQMPKLIADIKTGNDIEMRDNGIKLEDFRPTSACRAVDFNASEFIRKLESDLAVLMELQDNNNNNTVSPEDIKKPLSVVRKRLLTMLDRSLYHQLAHSEKVTIAKANLIAGICTAAIHTGYCKDALALYRQSLTLFRELNTDAMNNGYAGEDDNDNKKKDIDPFILSLINNCNSNHSDAGKYSMFIVVIYYQMSLLYDKSLIEKVQKSRYYLIQALNLLVRENAMNSNKYCIETLQRLALFALETGKDSEYISMMIITLNILKKCNENIGKILDVEIHFAKNLLSYGHQLPNTNNACQRQRFESVKAEYQKLLTQIITDAKQENTTINTETRRTLSKLLELAKFLLSYNQLAESYKVYHCMRKMCDDTQINLDLDFMKIWLTFVREFIGSIVKQNTAQIPQPMGGNGKVLWSEQILELCEFDVKVLEKIQQTTDIQIGTDIYKEYILCCNALIAVNINHDSQIIQRCKIYLNKAIHSTEQDVRQNAQNILQNIDQKLSIHSTNMLNNTSNN